MRGPIASALPECDKSLLNHDDMHLATPLLHSLLACLQKMDLSPRELLAPDGLVEADLAAAWPAVSSRAMTALWRNAAHQTLDSYLPFRVGGQLYVEQLGILGYILRNCGHLGAALGKLEKYNRLTNDFVDFQHQAAGSVVEISFRFSEKAPTRSFLRRVFTLLELGVLTSGLAQLINRPTVPVCVRFELERVMHLWGFEHCRKIAEVQKSPRRHFLGFGGPARRLRSTSTSQKNCLNSLTSS